MFLSSAVSLVFLLSINSQAQVLTNSPFSVVCKGNSVSAYAKEGKTSVQFTNVIYNQEGKVARFTVKKDPVGTDHSKNKPFSLSVSLTKEGSVNSFYGSVNKQLVVKNNSDNQLSPQQMEADEIVKLALNELPKFNGCCNTEASATCAAKLEQPSPKKGARSALTQDR